MQAGKRGVVGAPEGSLLRLLVQIPGNAGRGPCSSCTQWPRAAGVAEVTVTVPPLSVSQSVSHVGLTQLALQSKG